MQNSSLTLKVTIAGRMSVRLLTVINSADEARMRRFVQSDYAAFVLREHSVDDIVARLLEIKAETNGLEIFKVYFSQKFQTVLITRARKTGDLFLTKLRVDDLPPHGIVEFLLEKPTIDLDDSPDDPQTL